jgi:class 3 adenylate cyclase
MEQIDNFDINTPESKLLLHFYEKIISGELKTFDSLTQYSSKLPVSTKLRKCLFKSFELQRKLYWGFFIELTPKTHPRLWREIVIPDRKFKFGGNLKRAMSVPDIYLGLLDIHGYTKYCQDKKRNMSMVDLLDRMIYEDVKAICWDAGVISKRARGDEILVIGASALDVLKSTLQIIDYFNTQGRSFRNTVISKKLPGTVLPKFQISAGIAGGQKYTPLVITRDGDISGDIVNTAARLQAKANRISPEHNRIMITNHAYQKFEVAMKEGADDFFSRIDFFNIGMVEFKGVSQNVYDIVFLPEEANRLLLCESMEELYRCLEKKLWKSKILEASLDAAAKALKILLENGCRDTTAGRSLKNKCGNLLEQIKLTWKSFYSTNYEETIRVFSQVVDEMAEIKQIDKIVIEYLQLVQRDYQEIKNAYVRTLDEEVEIRINELYGPKEKSSYLLLKKHQSMYDKIQSTNRLKLPNRKKIWLRTADDVGDELNINLQSFKQ